MTISRPGERLALPSKREHRKCFVCGRANSEGLGLEFTVLSDGSVTASFPCQNIYQGYDDLLHGGIISCLLDGAMTNCLLARGLTATTGDLAVRFVRPVTVGTPVTVTAKLIRSRPPLYVLESELVQDGKRVARATGKFMETARNEQSP